MRRPVSDFRFALMDDCRSACLTRTERLASSLSGHRPGSMKSVWVQRQDSRGYLRKHKREDIEWMGEMTDTSLSSDIAAGDIDAALERVAEHRVTWVESQLDYDMMDAHAEHVSTFFERWLPSLPPLERLQAAEWASTQYILPLVHLEHSYGIGARLLLEAQQAATSELANSYRAFWALTDGPDAEVSGSVAERLARYAEQLEQMSFEDTD